MANIEQYSVLEACKRILLCSKFHDVCFICSDGKRVGCNRSFVAASCEYFEKLLIDFNPVQGGCLGEQQATADIVLQAPSAAVTHVLHYLHCGSFASLESPADKEDQEQHWLTLLETCSLAQLYMLPALQEHIADQLLQELPPGSLGLALSCALRAHLQLVVKNIWVALPRLLQQQPLHFDASYSAEAICMCLQHTCWLSTPATTSAFSNTFQAAGAGAAGPGRAAAVQAGTQAAAPVGRTAFGSNTTAADTAAVMLHCSSSSGTAAREAEAFDAVMEWVLREAGGCTHCQQLRQAPAAAATDANATGPSGSGDSSHAQQPHQPAAKKLQGSAAACSLGCRTSSNGSSIGTSSAVHPAGWTASGCISLALAGSSIARSSPCVMSRAGAHYSASGTSAAGRWSSSSSTSSSSPDDNGLSTEVAAEGKEVAAAAAGQQLAGNSSNSSKRPSSAPASLILQQAVTGACHPVGSSSLHAAGWLNTNDAAAAAAATAAATAAYGADCASAEQSLLAHGHCCSRHEAVLLQLLARLSWQLLPPAALQRLEGLALLSPAALLDIYRVHQRCSHLALWGSFPATTTVLSAGGGEAGRLRCYTASGEQVLECDSPAHITASANMWLSSGKHCWQVVLLAPCDLVWLGVGDGSLAPDVWGGRQAGGWFYGSNDALCHDRHSDKHAYDKHAGHGPWGTPGAVVDVCLDMDARELWFGVDGAQLKLGFTGLPARVQPAISMRAPGQLLVRFRAASMLTAELVSGSSGAGGSSGATSACVSTCRRETMA